MTVRTRVECNVDFPDDTIEDDEDIVQFPGKGISEVIAEILRNVGCQVSEPIYADEHGWELNISFKKRALWCQVSWADTCYIILEDHTAFPRSLHDPGFIEVLAKLNDGLRGDPRFQNILWYEQPRGWFRRLHTDIPAETPVG